CGLQRQLPVSSQNSAVGQVWTTHLPPQPSGWPQVLPTQLGAHTQRPNWHCPAPGQGVGPQSQVFLHWPFSHTAPAAQVTLAHGSATQLPPTQRWPPGQVTLAHGSG